MDLQPPDNTPLNTSDDTIKQPPLSSPTENPTSTINNESNQDFDLNHVNLPVTNPIEDSMLNVSKDVTLDPAMMGNMLVSGDYSRLDKGCFAVYKVVVLLVPITWLILSSLQMHFFGSIQAAYLLIFSVIEFLAIKKRDLRKSAIAVLGFKIYLVAYPCIFIVLSLIYHGIQIEEFLFLLMQMMAFNVFFMFGALQVWSYLAKLQQGEDVETGSTDYVYLSSLCFLCFAMQ